MSNTSRRRPTARSMREFTSSTTSRPIRCKTSLAGLGMEQPASNDRALTLDEAVSVAIALQQAQQLAAAEDIYSTVLEASPNHAAALHFSGVLAHQRARGEEAVALIERSLELEPERA